MYTWEITEGNDVVTINSEKNTAVVSTQKEGTFTLKVTYKAPNQKTCHKEFKGSVVKLLELPLCAHIVRSVDDTAGTVRTEDDIKKLVDEANKIWMQCCIRFKLVKTVKTQTLKRIANTVHYSENPFDDEDAGIDQRTFG